MQIQTHPTLQTNLRQQRGFTLVEVMVVIVILGILATIVGRNVIGASDEARTETAKMAVLEFKKVVESFYVKEARMPEDWNQLIEKDSTGKSYLDANEPPVDPWGKEYVLQRGERANHMIIISAGPDKQEGTDDDITSENARSREKK
jgi:general secretion pathway protein G